MPEEGQNQGNGDGSSGEGSNAGAEGSARKFGDGSQGEGSAAPAHWSTHIKDEGVRGNQTITQMQNVNSAEGAIDSLSTQLVHAQKALGTSRIEKPNENWTPEQHTKFHQEVMGVPEKYDGYKLENLKTPEGFTEGQAAYVESFHKLNMTPSQVEGVLANHYEKTAAANTERVEVVNQQVNANTLTMQTEWGDKYGFNVEIAERGLAQYADEGLMKTLQDNPDIMSNPSVQKMFYTLGSLELDDTIRNSNYTDLNGANRAAKIEEEITSLETYDLYVKMLQGKTEKTEKIQVDEMKTRRTMLHSELSTMKRKAAQIT